MDNVKSWAKDQKSIFILIVAICAVILGIITLVRLQGVSKTPVEIVPSNSTVETEKSKTIYIDVQGAVTTPGVYEVREGDILNSVIEMAGGILQEADSKFIETQINRAQVLTDGQKIYIPFEGEFIENDVLNEELVDEKVNINTASSSKLEELPGVGPSTASKIIEGRPYNSVDDLKNVSGIGNSTYLKIKDLVRI